MSKPIRKPGLIKSESSKLKYEIKALKSKVRELEEKLSNRGKTMYYWLKPDESISNLWDEEDHKKYLNENDITDAENNGWSLKTIKVLNEEEVYSYSEEELFKIIQSYEKHCMGMNYVISKEIIDKDIYEFISAYKK